MATPSQRYRWGLLAYTGAALISAKQKAVIPAMLKSVLFFIGNLLFGPFDPKDGKGPFFVYNFYLTGEKGHSKPLRSLFRTYYGWAGIHYSSNLQNRVNGLMQKHLVLVGGGHAHLFTLMHLNRILGLGHAVTVIGPSPYHYYSGMGPGMLGGRYLPEEIRIPIRDLVEHRGGRFIMDAAIRVDAPGKRIHLASGRSLPYDVISFNTGSDVPRIPNRAGDPDRILPVKPIENLIRARRQILALNPQEKGILGVVGGGPSSVEISGNLWRLCRDHNRKSLSIQILAGKRLLPKAPEKVRRMARNSLIRRGIQILENSHVSGVEGGEAILESGRRFPFTLLLLAHGIRPNPLFKNSGISTGPDGGLCVNPFLQHPDFPEIFGGGDSIFFLEKPLDKVGVYSVRQNPVLFENLVAALEGTRLRPFHPGRSYLQVYNLGDDTGIFWRNKLIFNGRSAFWIKDFIDRNFMKQF